MNKKVKTVSRCLASLVAVLSISTASMFAEKNYKIVERMQLSYHLHEGAYFDDDSYTKPYLNTEIVEEGNKIRVYVDFDHKKLPAKISNGHLIVGDYKYVLDGLEKKTISSYVINNFDLFDDNFKKEFVIKYSCDVLNKLNGSIKTQFHNYKSKLFDLINKEISKRRKSTP